MSTEARIIDLDEQEPTDAEIISFHELMTGPDQLRWEYDPSWAERIMTPEEIVEDFRTRRRKQRGRNHPLWAIHSGEVVGMIGINRFEDAPRRHSAELGYGVAAAYTRRGIGSRLLAAAIEKARTLGLERLEADCFAENVASIALLEKHGFRREGVRLGAIRKDGATRDQALFGLNL